MFNLPLKDIKILDLSEGLSCALATKYFADFGAKVVKIEKPSGDKTRKWAPLKNGESLYFNYLNSGKQSITLDIKTEYGINIFKRLVKKYDVICTSHETNYMENLGIDYESLKKLKSNIIYASCTYFGDYGPLSGAPGSSIVAQARGVAMDMTGVENGYPVKCAPSVAEHYAAGYLYTGIMLAIIDKINRGIGQKVDISILDSIFSCIEAAPAAYSMTNEIHTRRGNFDPAAAPYDTYETQDGYVAIGCSTQSQWHKLCKALGFEDLENDPRFAEQETRRAGYLDNLQPILRERMIKFKKDYVQEACLENGIPCSTVMNIKEISDLPDIKQYGFLFDAHDTVFGKISYPSNPFKLSDSAQKEWSHAPRLGENTSSVLMEIGEFDDIDRDKQIG